MTIHIMVDLETWGKTPGSDIRSIGAVVFDPIAGTLGEEFYVNVDNPVRADARPGFADPASPFADRVYPVYRDPETVQWWADQSEAAQQRLTTDVVDLQEGLLLFIGWWARHAAPDATFWAHGPHFDEAILAACYRAVVRNVPWHYRAARDTRTIYEAAGWPAVPFEGTQHDALADAKHQARCVIESYRLINGDRVNGLLAANNREIEKRRGAVALLREAGGVFRTYEQHHRDKAIGNVHADDRNRKAERNAEIADRIEAFIEGVHS